MGSVPAWATVLVAGMWSRVENPAGLLFYCIALAVLSLPVALFTVYIVTPAVRWPFRGRPDTIGSIVLATVLLGLVATGEYWLWTRLERESTQGWLIGPLYLGVFLIPPVYFGCVFQAVAESRAEAPSA